MKSMFSKNKHLNKYTVIFISLLAVAGIFYGGFFYGTKPKTGKRKRIQHNQSRSRQAAGSGYCSVLDGLEYGEFQVCFRQRFGRAKNGLGRGGGNGKIFGRPLFRVFPASRKQGIQRHDKRRLWRSGNGNRNKGRNGDGDFSLEGNSGGTGRNKSGRQNLKNRRQNHFGYDGTEEAARLIRGEKGTPIKLLLLPKGEEKTKEVSLIRDTIVVPILETEEKPGGIFLIKLYSFSGNSTNEFRNALRKFVYSGNSKMIIDLRGNPGGYLESAVDASSWFLPIGKTVVREKFGNGEENLFKSKGYNIFDNLPLAILVNEGSASASEIMAGALREHDVLNSSAPKLSARVPCRSLLKLRPRLR